MVSGFGYEENKTLFILLFGFYRASAVILVLGGFGWAF